MSLAIVTRDLDFHVRQRIARDLANGLFVAPDLEVRAAALAELLRHRDRYEWQDVDETMSESFDALLNDDSIELTDERCKCIFEMYEKILSFALNVDTVCRSVLKEYITHGSFIPEMAPVTGPSKMGEPEEPVDDAQKRIVTIRAKRLLFLLQCMFREVPEAAGIETLVRLTTFQGAKDMELATLANKALGAALSPKSIGLFGDHQQAGVWSTQKLLVTCRSPENKRLGYRSWLWMVSRMELSGSVHFQEIVGNESYWMNIAKGLVGTSHDIRRFCVSLLLKSLQQVSRNIDLDIMYFDLDVRDSILNEWRRYCAIVEIVAVDASVNQAQDALPDLLHMLSAKSCIPQYWATNLLRLAMRSSMEQIRLVIANAVVRLPACDLSRFKSDLSLLTDIILRFSIQAPFFTVTKLADSERHWCPHLALVTDFVSRLISALDDANATEAVQRILQLLEDLQTSFDPARIAVLRGLRAGLFPREPHSKAPRLPLVFASLEGKIQDRDPWLYKSQWELAQKRDVLTDQNWRQLKRIAEIPFESPFRRGAAAVYCIEILMASGPTSVNIEWVQALTSFTRGNEKTVSKLYDDLAGFLLVRGEMDLFLSCTQIIDPLTYAAVFCRAFYRHGVVQEISHWKKDDFNLDYYCDIIKFAQYDSLVEKFLHTNYIRQAIHGCLEIECTNMNISLSASAVLTSYNPALGMIPIDWLKPDKSGQQTIHDLSSQAGLKSRALTLSFLSVFPETQCLSYDNQVPIDGSDIVATLLLLNKELLPSVPANDRGCRENAITACFRYISSRLRVLKTTTSESSGILRAVESMCDAAGYEARKAMCSVVSSLMDNESANDLEQLSSTLRAMWFSLVEDRLSAGERDLHTQFIQLALSPKVVALGVPGLEEIAQGIIEQSFARRNLVLPLTLALTGTSIGPKISRMSPRNQPMWVPRILADVHIHQQITDQAFRLEDVLAGHLDHELGLVCGEWAYDAFYMAPESAARAIAIQYLANNSWCASEVFEHIISSPEYHIFEPRKRNDDVEEQTRVQCYQVLLVCQRFLETERAVGYLNANLLPALDSEPSQCVRLYIEWIVAGICARDIENHARPIVLKSLQNTDLPPRLSNSFQRIGLLLSRYLAREGTKLARPFFRDYVKLMLPLATSNRAGIRHFSTAMLYGVDEDVKHNAFIADILADYKEVVSGVARVAGGAETFELYWAGERFVWDLDDLELDRVCGGVLRRITERQLYIIPPNILEKYADVAPRTGNEQDRSDISTPYPDLLTESQPVPELDDKRGALQTKSGAYESFANDDDEHLIKRGELIVLASLVDKVPNLGGICRLCDALGARLLCLNDMTVVKTTQFKGVAVTAEQWMPMTEVPESTIITYMREQKRAGYTLVGLEQTDNSVELKPSLQFPRKTLLLIGKEREGIPGELLAELDFCVEIKQVGVVRSMNIQTATAIVVHAYASQHC